MMTFANNNEANIAKYTYNIFIVRWFSRGSKLLLFSSMSCIREEREQWHQWIPLDQSFISSKNKIKDH